MQMITADERAHALEQIKSAYQVLGLYEEKEKAEAQSFAETAFSLSAYGIASIAKILGFEEFFRGIMS